jgi:hypothetical protein
MEPENTGESGYEIADAAKRWERIRQLGGATPSHEPAPKPAAPATAPTLPVQRTFWRRWQVWVAAIVLFALAAGIASTLPPHRGGSPKTDRRAPPVQIVPGHDLIECPADMAWSRDQRFLAVLGYASACPFTVNPYTGGQTVLTPGMYRGPLPRFVVNDIAPTGALAIYSASRGTLITQTKLDDVIYAKIQFPKAYVDWMRSSIQASPESLAAVNYLHVVWSPTAKQLYVTFDVYVPTGPSHNETLPGYLEDGLLEISAQGGVPIAYLHRAASIADGVTIWDLATGSVRATIPATSPFALAPAGLDYAWADDLLTVQDPASPRQAPAAPALRPVGAPESGASAFSIWQPGVVADTLAAHQVGMRDLPGVPTFTMDTTALSPDGRVLAAGLGVSSLLITSKKTAPDAAARSAYGWSAAPLLPMRDAALSAITATADQFGSGVGGNWLGQQVAVAWRPDGAALAAQANIRTANGPQTRVTILSSATGKTLDALTAPPLSGGNFNQGQATLIRWSPDGHELAYFDSSTGAITIWDQASLPA